MSTAPLPRIAWTMILGALILVVAGLLLVPFGSIALASSGAAAASAIEASQLPPAPTPSGPATAPAQIPAPPRGAQAPLPTVILQGTWLWQRSEYGDDSTVVATDPSRYSISFQDGGRLALRADCNQGSATYTLQGPQITVVPGAMTAAACPPGSQDFVFLRDLRNVATYVMDGQDLVLNLKVDAGNMIFRPQPPLSLSGQPWRVQSYNNGAGGVVSVLPDVELTAAFEQDGSVSGNAGCNLYRGPYTVVDDRLTFGPLTSTRRACLSDALNQQESAFLAALNATTTYTLVGDRLTLRNDAGETQVVLVRPSAPPFPSPAPGAP